MLGSEPLQHLLFGFWSWDVGQWSRMYSISLWPEGSTVRPHAVSLTHQSSPSVSESTLAVQPGRLPMAWSACKQRQCLASNPTVMGTYASNMMP